MTLCAVMLDNERIKGEQLYMTKAYILFSLKVDEIDRSL